MLTISYTGIPIGVCPPPKSYEEHAFLFEEFHLEEMACRNADFLIPAHWTLPAFDLMDPGRGVVYRHCYISEYARGRLSATGSIDLEAVWVSYSWEEPLKRTRG